MNLWPDKSHLVKQAARFSQAVYGNEQALPGGIMPIRRFDDEARSLHALAYLWEDMLVITVAGTQDLRNWLSNLQAWKTEFHGLRAHNGFADYAGALLPWLREIYGFFPQLPLVLTGHSMGGAVACLLGVAMDPLPVSVITFGQPKVAWGPDLAKNFQVGRAWYIRVQNGSDLVPRRPMLFYSHAGELWYWSNDGKLWIDPPWWKTLWDRTWTLAQGQRLTDHATQDYIRQMKRIPTMEAMT